MIYIIGSVSDFLPCPKTLIGIQKCATETP